MRSDKSDAINYGSIKVPYFLKGLRAESPVYFSAEVKTWVAVSTGVILFITAGVLHSVYRTVQQTISISDDPYSSSNAWFFASLTIVPIAIWIHKRWTQDTPKISSQFKFNPIFVGTLSGVIFFALFLLSINLLTEDVKANYVKSSAEFANFLWDAKIYQLLAFVIAMDVLRPVLEEVIFRGFIFQSIAKKYSLIVGMLISSGGFVIIHLGMILSPVHIFMFGLVSCLFVYFYRTLYASYSLHITYNLLITIFALLRGV